MKLKIVEPGWTNFSGDFGGIEFFENVSVEDVSPRDASRLANAIQIETLEGANPSSSQSVLDSLVTPMSIVGDLPSTAVAGEGEATKAAITLYTKEALQAVADSGGIEGLRKIAAPMGLTSKSIVGLMDQIINNQGGHVIAGATGTEPQSLVGSSKQPASFLVENKTVQLGSVVRLAFEAFEKDDKTVADWNVLPDEIREKLIADQVAAMKV